MARLVVVGAGAMGLAVAYHALKAGHQVDLIEAGPVPGGMAAHFDLDGLSIERFYHFVCKSDYPTFDLMNELGIGDLMYWRATSMGYFTNNRLYPWGNPVALLTFPAMSLMARIRYGVFAFVSTRRERWDAIETEPAHEWLLRWCGREGYDRLWGPLLDLKFFGYAKNISAAWIWTRVKRIGRSRKSLFEEQLGYIQGGSEVLVKALVDKIMALGGRVHLSNIVRRVNTDGSKVTGVTTDQGEFAADHVILTIPTPLVSNIVPSLPEEWKAKYDAIANIGVCCLIFKLKKSVTPNFWVNISQPGVEIPGIIEFSNLRPMDDHVVYVPYYMPIDHPKFSWSDDALLAEALKAIQTINPDIAPSDVMSARVSRLKHAQPICEPGFAAKLPPVQTPIDGLQIADTCFYYPEDRGISESVRFGKDMAARVVG